MIILIAIILLIVITNTWIKLIFLFVYSYIICICKIAEDVIETVMWKLLGSDGPGGMDLEALQGWLLNFKYHSKTFV